MAKTTAARNTSHRRVPCAVCKAGYETRLAHLSVSHHHGPFSHAHIKTDAVQRKYLHQKYLHQHLSVAILLAAVVRHV